jgi:hypothetical protein
MNHVLLATAPAGETRQEDEERECLIAQLLLAYAFTHADVARLASLLADGYLAAMQRAARRALTTVSAAATWIPSPQQRKDATTQAMEAAKSIAATFSSLLEGFFRRLGATLVDFRATLTGIASWVHTLLQWKVPQIVNATIQSGKQAGTREIVRQILAGEVVREDDPTVVIGEEDAVIEVIPETASNDLCADYAGRRFPLSAWDMLPDWPIHVSCPHENVVVPIAA